MWKTNHTPDEFCPDGFARKEYAYSVWEKCLETVRSNEDPSHDWSIRKAALTSSLGQVSDAHEKYFLSAQEDALWKLEESEFQYGEKSREYSGWLYAEKLKGYTAVDKLREKILATSLDDLCPYCNHRNVYDLDHFLPKEKFHLIAVNPWNLVPCCKECNAHKSAFVPNSENEQFYHPYFFSVENKKWLKARVIESVKPVIDFYVAENLTEHNRINNIFEKLRLNRLYKAQTARELLVFSRSFERLRDMPEPMVRQRVKIKLDELSAERDFLSNDWRGAMFSALAGSEWYCSVGFKSSWRNHSETVKLN